MAELYVVFRKLVKDNPFRCHRCGGQATHVVYCDDFFGVGNHPATCQGCIDELKSSAGVTQLQKGGRA